MVFLIKLLQVILALSILVLVHELGHFFFAKLFRIKVDKFYLFFDIGGFALFRFKPKGSDTEYGIGWLPLGGYCKICGMIDESMDTESLKQEPQPWEFRSKPAWQRLLVMSGGVLFNFILAILLYIGILAGWGESYVSNEGNSIYVNELAYDMGFRNGDHIIRFDEYVPENFGMLQADLARQTARKATVLRGKDTIDIYIDHSRLGDILNTPGMFGLAMPFIIDTVPPSSVNYAAGLAKGDRIVSIDGVHIDFIQDSRKLLADRAGQEVPVTVTRGMDTLEMALQIDTAGRFGIYTSMPGLKTREYSIPEAIPAGFRLTFSTIGGYLKDLKLVFTPSTEAYKSVGSFITIGQIFPSAWDWFSFINILALLSIMLGVMNLLPIPALDGGHIVFTIYEMVTGKKPSDRFLTVAQIIGMALLFCLMILAFGNDIARLFR
ncbi:MAG: RIP metalloprotease RseP [Bacteroidales bacterium]|nr:RIP metalloprotease RseP [Bacteroides sp.]MCM1199022.1 RIP metalloprotease RseP [Clostridium sp.]MCM1502422.1 RIP metalloprotease RseP [Bacteroidales bacterium]